MTMNRTVAGNNEVGVHAQVHPGGTVTEPDGRCWRVEAAVGSGTCCTVWSVHLESQPSHKAALKIYRFGDLYEAAASREHLLVDLVCTARGKCPYIVEVSECFTRDGHACLIQTPLEGDLHQLRTRNLGQVLSLAVTRLLLSHLLRGLSTLHSVGFVHADLKPANLLWNPQEGVLTIIDFGLSFHVMDTAVGELQSPGYRAPEVQLWNDSLTNKRSPSSPMYTPQKSTDIRKGSARCQTRTDLDFSTPLSSSSQTTQLSSCTVTAPWLCKPCDSHQQQGKKRTHNNAIQLGLHSSGGQTTTCPASTCPTTTCPTTTCQTTTCPASTCLTTTCPTTTCPTTTCPASTCPTTTCPTTTCPTTTCLTSTCPTTTCPTTTCSTTTCPASTCPTTTCPTTTCPASTCLTTTCPTTTCSTTTCPASTCPTTTCPTTTCPTTTCPTSTCPTTTCPTTTCPASTCLKTTCPTITGPTPTFPAFTCSTTTCPTTTFSTTTCPGRGGWTHTSGVSDELEGAAVCSVNDAGRACSGAHLGHTAVSKPDPSADMWSVGCLILYLVTGSKFFTSKRRAVLASKTKADSRTLQAILDAMVYEAMKKRCEQSRKEADRSTLEQLRELCSSLLQTDRYKRPSASTVLNHAFFTTPQELSHRDLLLLPCPILRVLNAMEVGKPYQPQETYDILEEIQEGCEKYGKVKEVAAFKETVYVVFALWTAAVEACGQLFRKRFDGRLLLVSYFPIEEYTKHRLEAIVISRNAT